MTKAINTNFKLLEETYIKSSWGQYVIKSGIKLRVIVPIRVLYSDSTILIKLVL